MNRSKEITLFYQRVRRQLLTASTFPDAWDPLIRDYPEHLLFFQILQNVLQRFPEGAEHLKEKKVELRGFREEDIMPLISGNFTPEEAIAFLQHVYHSYPYFARLVTYLENTGTTIKEFKESRSFTEVTTLEELSRILFERYASHPPTPVDAGKAKQQKSGKAEARKLRLGDRHSSMFLYFAAAAVLILALVVFLRERHASPSPSPGEALVFDTQVPFEYLSRTYRGSSTEQTELTPDTRAFVDQVLLGIGSYSLRHYREAIELFRGLESQAVALQAETQPVQLKPWVFRYYFYWGLSHLAYSRTQQESLSLQHRKRHLQAAIEKLNKARLLELNQPIRESAALNYFLGLAYFLSKQPHTASAYLRQIPPDNPFYPQAQQVLSRILQTQ